LTWKGSHASPSTAILPSLPTAIAGSLLPVELANGEVVTSKLGAQVEISSVFETASRSASVLPKLRR
jgi:hypothetical protein